MGREQTQFTLAATGDSILSRKISACEDDRFLSLVERIRQADASFTNLELVLDNGDGYPTANTLGPHLSVRPWAADELDWAGFNLYSVANNHMGDYGRGGMESTIRELRRRELTFAGLGPNLAEARAPSYLETPGGRVALVSVCTTISPGTEAGKQRSDMHGRPGISPLHLDVQYVVPDEHYDNIVEISERLGLEDVKTLYSETSSAHDTGNDTFDLLSGKLQSPNIEFVRGDEFDIDISVDEADTNAVTREVRSAAMRADWVVVSLHTHEGKNGMFNDPSIPEFLREFSRRTIDAGADAVVGHGPHRLRGIELYRDAPIFYSLGNFLFQIETIQKFPAEMYDKYGLEQEHNGPADVLTERIYDDDGNVTSYPANQVYWESLLPVCRFGENGLAEIELLPVDLGYGQSHSQRGHPRHAIDSRRARILEEIADLSKPLGTEIEIDDQKGTIQP
jgi:poly-gamma-glutamate synthesis protein (capsule biosynthesis protein)